MNKLAIPAGAAAGSAVFCVLLERLNLFGVFWGAAAGIAALTVLKGKSRGGNSLKPGLWMPAYLCHLLACMAKSTVNLIRLVLRPRPPYVSVADIPATAGEQARVIVANSITLTPGTLTLEETKDYYTVLCMSSSNGVPPDTAAVFERCIKEGTDD